MFNYADAETLTDRHSSLGSRTFADPYGGRESSMRCNFRKHMQIKETTSSIWQHSRCKCSQHNQKRNVLQIKCIWLCCEHLQRVSLFVCVVSICTICCQNDENLFLICWWFFYLHVFWSCTSENVYNPRPPDPAAETGNRFRCSLTIRLMTIRVCSSVFERSSLYSWIHLFLAFALYT